jgi:hypothetical protein
MSLILSSLIQLNSGNTSLTMFDNTGDYSLLNPGGYGTPNPATSDVTKATLTIDIQGYNSYAPVTVDITANFADLFTTGYVLTAMSALNLPVFPDGWYKFTYSIIALGIEYNYINTNAFWGDVQCCVKKAVLQLSIPVTDVKKAEQVHYLALVFDSLTSSACCSNMDSFTSKLKELKKLCGGCGDSNYLNSTNTNGSYSGGCKGGCN